MYANFFKYIFCLFSLSSLPHYSVHITRSSSVYFSIRSPKRFIITPYLNAHDALRACLVNPALTLLSGRTMKAPPPLASTIMATNLGLTEQKLLSHVI